MTRTKSKAKNATRMGKPAAPKSRAPTAPAAQQTKARTNTKHAKIIAMLQAHAGATIAAIVAVTGWQRHSVRGFLAGVVRKKLRLNLVSEPSDKGRIYRIKDSKASCAATGRAKQAA